MWEVLLNDDNDFIVQSYKGSSFYHSLLYVTQEKFRGINIISSDSEIKREK